MITRADLEFHAMLHRRVVERYKATENPNPLVLQILSMLEEEYTAAYQILPPEETAV